MSEICISPIMESIIASIVVLFGLFFLTQPMLKCSLVAIILPDGHLSFSLTNSSIFPIRDIRIHLYWKTHLNENDDLLEEIELYTKNVEYLSSCFRQENQKVVAIDTKEIFPIENLKEKSLVAHIFSTNVITNVTNKKEYQYCDHDVFFSEREYSPLLSCQFNEVTLERKIWESISNYFKLYMAISILVLCLCSFLWKEHICWFVLLFIWLTAVVLLVADVAYFDHKAKEEDVDIWRGNRERYHF